MTVDEYKKLKPGKRNKYGNTKTDGYDSVRERDRHAELLLLQKAGAISDLERQVKFVLIAKSQYGQELRYVADFTYFESGRLVVEDVKSEPTKTPLYRWKKRMMAERYGILIRET